MSANEFGEKRRYQRLKIKVPISYYIKSNKTYGAALTSDFSLGGLKFASDEFIPAQTEFIIDMFLAELTKSLNVTGKVVWSQRFPYSNRYYSGVKFTEISPENKNCISEYVSNHRYLL
ncbi:MAG: PilZ domain-containing protein [Candidatus Omnitrophota bacterium]